VVSFTRWPFYPQRRSLLYPLNKRMGGSQSWFGCSGKEKKVPSLPLLGIKPWSSSPWPSHYTDWVTGKDTKIEHSGLRPHLSQPFRTMYFTAFMFNNQFSYFSLLYRGRFKYHTSCILWPWTLLQSDIKCLHENKCVLHWSKHIFKMHYLQFCTPWKLWCSFSSDTNLMFQS